MKLLVEKKELWCKFVPETNKDIAIHNLNVLAWNACRQAQKELLDKELTVERIQKLFFETLRCKRDSNQILHFQFKGKNGTDKMRMSDLEDFAQAIIKELKGE